MSPVRTSTAALLAGLLCALWLASPAAWAQYKWKDSRGQTHVSDLPPPTDVPDKDVLQRPATRQVPAAAAAAAPYVSASAAAATNRPPADPELQARQRRTEQETQAKARADEARLAEQRAGNCQRARSQLAMLDSGQRMIRIDAQGERVVVDDATRQVEAQQARQVVSSECR